MNTWNLVGWTLVLSALLLPGPSLVLTGADVSSAPHAVPTGITNGSPVSNFTASLNRLVALVAGAGGALLALAWTRVALSWFSNDITKKVQAKERARDALIGTLLFVAAVTGLVWALARWVLTGS